MQWDLDVLYHGFDDAQLTQDFDRAFAVCRSGLAAFQRPSDDVPAMLAQGLEALTEAANRLILLGSYIQLTLSVDATCAPALALLDKLMNLQVEAEQLSSAFARYVGALPDLKAVIQGNDAFAPYSFMLTDAAEQAAHLLPEALEPTVLRMQMTGGRAWEQLRNLMDGTMQVELVQDGQTVSLPLPEVRNMAYSGDPALRKAAYEAELAAYPKVETAMAACLNGIKGEALTLADLKGYDSVLDMTLAHSRMDRATLEAMLTAIREALPDFRRYLKAKAKLLGHAKGLPFYDLFAPVGSSGHTYTLEEARDYLLRVLGPFSPNMAEVIRRAFDERWIDAYPRPGKQGGAFCNGLHPLGQSRVMTNFDGTFGAVTTLAHELGHAFHDYCLKEEAVLNTDYPMPLAETASIFNETLMTQAALAQAEPEEAFSLLENELMEANQVVVDILSRYLFETEVVETRKQRTLTAQELQDIMLRAQRESYGDGLDADYLHPYMWACKSHYYSADVHFYNFPYAFGLLFGKGIYARYEAQGASFVPAYERLLALCGKDTVAGVAAGVGIDVRSVDFWRSSLDILRQDIDRFEALVAQRLS